MAATGTATRPTSEKIIASEDEETVLHRVITPLDQRGLGVPFGHFTGLPLRREPAHLFLVLSADSSGRFRKDEHAGAKTDLRSARESAAFAKNSFGSIS